MPKIVEVQFEGISPYSQSRKYNDEVPKLDKEGPDDYDIRTWREKCTTDDEGNIVIPAMAMKQALDTTAKRFGDTIPGKGKATYTKHFVGGVICEGDVRIGHKKENCPCITLSVSSTGIRGSTSGSKRVTRRFPQWSKWSGTARFVVLDDTITKAVFERYFTEAGRFTGVGRFRPENGGLNGRWKPVAFKWSEV